MEVCGKEIRTPGRLIRIAFLDGEGYQFPEEPKEASGALRKSGVGIDLSNDKSAEALMSLVGKALESASETTLQSEGRSTDVGHTEIRVSGRAVWVPSAQIDGRTVIITGKWLKIAAVHDEDQVEGELLCEPASFVLQLKQTGLNADIFTFPQRLPASAPKYTYHLEWDNLAVIPMTTFSDWWDKRVEPSVRRAVRKAAKAGVVVTPAELDEEFVRGIVSIYNETPVRQGKPFWHFQKAIEAVKRENSTYPGRNIFLGAYYLGELVGFMRMIHTDGVASVSQLVTMMKHFEKRPANALIAKAVEVCQQRGYSHLVYCDYVYNDPKSSLTEFKRRNGFEQVLLPRYYVPLTLKGKVALRLGLHRGLAKRIPAPLVTQILRIRSLWYTRRLKAAQKPMPGIIGLIRKMPLQRAVGQLVGMVEALRHPHTSKTTCRPNGRKATRMSDSGRWRQFWEEKSKANVTDFEVDRLTPPRDQEIENLSEQELVNFTAPEKSEIILDAGCGTGVNILRLHSGVRNIIGVDYTSSSLERCRRRMQMQKVTNAHLCLASVAAIPLPDRSVDRVLCLSVLQYMDDEEARQALREFARVLRPGGVIILHVKNSSSLYWLTLSFAKRLKGLLGWTTLTDHFRSFRWYAHELTCLNCDILDYNSLNLLTLARMPKRLLSLLQRTELRHRNALLLRGPFIRRHGADLKMKAAVADRGGKTAPLPKQLSKLPQALTPST